MKLSENFSRAEFEYSYTAERKNISNIMDDEQLIYAARFCLLIAEPWRELSGGESFRYSSMFRSYALNRILPGSARKSAHMMGRAGDKPLGNHKSRYGNLDNMYEELVQSAIPYDKAIIESNKRGQRWIHVQISKIGREPRGLMLSAKEVNGEMVYTLIS